MCSFFKLLWSISIDVKICSIGNSHYHWNVEMRVFLNYCFCLNRTLFEKFSVTSSYAFGKFTGIQLFWKKVNCIVTAIFDFCSIEWLPMFIMYLFAAFLFNFHRKDSTNSNRIMYTVERYCRMWMRTKLMRTWPERDRHSSCQGFVENQEIVNFSCFQNDDSKSLAMVIIKLA